MPICPNCNTYVDNSTGNCPVCHKPMIRNGSAPARSAPTFTRPATHSITHSQNAGSNVCTLAMILLAVNIIATIILAAVFGRTYDRYGYSFHFGRFLLYLLIGGIYSVANYVLLNAFGKMVEHTIFAAESADEQLRLLGKIGDDQTKILNRIADASDSANRTD